MTFPPQPLLVEGRDEASVIRNLMVSRGLWPRDWDKCPVDLIDANGVDNLLARIPVQLKQSDLRCLGVVVDADDNLNGRWQRVQQLVRPAFPATPSEMPESGLVVANDDGFRFGLWIMPDCRSAGMLETFLAALLPDTQGDRALWSHAETAFAAARTLQCPCREAHVDKAEVHTWLAWQDPPGQPFGLALQRKILDPHSDRATPFVAWLRRLYGS